MRAMRIWDYVDRAARLGSLRRAAEEFHITPSALQRRIQDLEEDLGFLIFERSPRGIRLTSAGENLIRWIRTQRADLERVQSQVEDLSGLRRGQVRIACSQALVQHFLPREISAFRAEFPKIRFDVSAVDHAVALKLVSDYATDLALVFWPSRDPDFQPLVTLGQGIAVVMAKDHPLAARASIRIRDCAHYPVALPQRGFGVRTLLDDHLATASTRLSVEIESNSFEMLHNLARQGGVLAFQFSIGATAENLPADLVARPLDDAERLHAPLVLGYRRGRSLPVAAAKFAEHLARRLDAARSLPLVDGPP